MSACRGMKTEYDYVIGGEYEMQENEIIFKLIGLLIGVVGSLLLCGGGLVVYIFKRHVQDNDCQFTKNRDEHKCADERLRKGGL